jgi:hypothetical protein
LLCSVQPTFRDEAAAGARLAEISDLKFQISDGEGNCADASLRSA